MSASKRKGTAMETEVVRFLQSMGIGGAERRALQGVADRGDISGVPGWTLEVKNCARMDLAGWMNEAQLEWLHDNSGKFVSRWWAVIHKRRGKGISRAYVTMELTQLATIILELEKTL